MTTTSDGVRRPGQWIGAASEQLGLAGEVDAANSPEPPRPAGPPTGEDLGPTAPTGTTPWLRPDVLRSQGRLPALGIRPRGPCPEPSPMPTTGPWSPCSIACRPKPVMSGGDVTGSELLEAEGFIGAAFRHRTSRAGDPQLHTHVVVPNLVQGSDGRWSAPDGRHLFVWQKAAGTMYQSALRAELAPLGLTWEVRRNGLGEVADHPEDDPQGIFEAQGGHRGCDGTTWGDVVEGSRDGRTGQSRSEAGEGRARRCAPRRVVGPAGQP